MNWLDYVILSIIAFAFMFALLYSVKNNKKGCSSCDKYEHCPFKNEEKCHKNK